MSIDSKNWMSGVSDKALVKDLILPGTHDTATYTKTAYVAPYVQTQVLGGSVYEQLQHGVRSFDLRIKQSGDEFFLYHGDFSVNVKIDEVQRDIQRFLEENPSETVLATLKNEGTPTFASVGDKPWKQVVYESLARFPTNSSINDGRSTNLWFSNYSDFKDINNRLGVDTNSDGVVDILSDGRQLFPDTDPIFLDQNSQLTQNDKLNYDALQLGDVRGKAIIIARGWPTEGANTNDTSKPWGIQIGLDATSKGYGPDNTSGAYVEPAYTSGLLIQDLYNRPKRSDKFQTILDFADPAKKIVQEEGGASLIGDNGSGYKFSYVSAHSVPWLSAKDYAEYVNPRLAQSLSSGELKSLATSGQLRGTFFADYILANQKSYNTFSTGIAASALSDWLPRLIYTSNKIADVAITLKGSSTVKSDFTEGQSFNLSFDSHNFAAGTTLYYTIKSQVTDDVIDSDLSSDSKNVNFDANNIVGRFIVGDNANKATFKVLDDQRVEGMEKFIVQLYSDEQLTQKQGTEDVIRVFDKKIESPANGVSTVNNISVGSKSSDTLNGSSGDEELFGGAGNDTLTGGVGIDVLEGGSGKDTLWGASNDERLDGGTGVDILDIASNFENKTDSQILNIEQIKMTSDRLTVDLSNQTEKLNIEGFRAGSSTILAGSGADLIFGGDGEDSINGGYGADRMVGGIGNDIYYIDNAKDKIIEANDGGADTARVSLSRYSLDKNVENLIYDGIDPLIAKGNALGNIIVGGDGTDIINGMKGKDSLKGNDGNDKFIFAAGDSVFNDYDTVVDFAIGDVIDYAKVIKLGGSSAPATNSQASVDQNSYKVSFASGSGTTLTDALGDIAASFTAAKDAAGEFALFQVNGAGDLYMMISDGKKGYGANDVVVRLGGTDSSSTFNLAFGDLTRTA